MTQITEKLKKFTILHSNDMHGDFLAEAKSGEGNLVGGLSLLSGYINKVRQDDDTNSIVERLLAVNSF
ncbi:3'-nucleotidase [Cylindrospermopsis curvispora]|uniref:3'-nucleotidase n=1 Tax=Cylindrospermopsis curvispora GIHE-G1 TaxID=2666332 RepID=A0A7H0F4B1_9CYAN|nr:3'-nucleotidase [Cylindrospermopsis curvispora]QNP30877.1 3'-nucleotidase [Cylindrospermopsis curvispora GIHE-G1]